MRRQMMPRAVYPEASKFDSALASGAAVAVILLLFTPYTDAGTSKGPFNGTVTPSTVQSLLGCGSARIPIQPTFAFSTNRGNLSVSTAARPCVGFTTAYSYTTSDGGVLIGLDLPPALLKSSHPLTRITLGLQISARLTTSENLTGPCPLATGVTAVNFSSPAYDYNYSYSYCDASASAYVAGIFRLIDTTNTTEWGANGTTLPCPSSLHPSDLCPNNGEYNWSMAEQNYSANYTSYFGIEYGPGNAINATPGAWRWANSTYQTPWGLSGSTRLLRTGSVWFNSTDVGKQHGAGRQHWTFSPADSYSIFIDLKAYAFAYFTGYHSGFASARVSEPAGFTILYVSAS